MNLVIQRASKGGFEWRFVEEPGESCRFSKATGVWKVAKSFGA